MSLRDDIQGYMTQFLRQAPQKVQGIMQEEAERLARSGITAKNLKVGDTAPLFSLPDIQGHMMDSQTLLGSGPLVVSFFRGGW